MSMPELSAQNDKSLSGIEMGKRDEKERYKFESTSSDDTMASKKNKKSKMLIPDVSLNPFHSTDFD